MARKGKEKIQEKETSPIEVYKDSDDELEEKTKHTNRCFPNKIVKAIDNIKKKRQTKKLHLLDESGFGAFKLLQVNRIFTPFLEWCCENFDRSTCELILSDDGRVKLTADDVKTVYDLPMGSKTIKLNKCKEADMKTLFQELGIGLQGGFKDKIDLNLLYMKLPSFKNIETWRKAMILCIIGYILCPPKNYKITLRYATLLKEKTQMTEYNWCGHVLQHLQNSIDPNCPYPNADFLFLMINHMGKFGGKDCRKSAPTCQHWTREMLFKRLKAMKEAWGFGGVVEHKAAGASTSNAPNQTLRMPTNFMIHIPINTDKINNLKECKDSIDLCKANILAWSNCLEELNIKEKELNNRLNSRKKQEGEREQRNAAKNKKSYANEKKELNMPTRNTPTRRKKEVQKSVKHTKKVDNGEKPTKKRPYLEIEKGKDRASKKTKTAKDLKHQTEELVEENKNEGAENSEKRIEKILEELLGKEVTAQMSIEAVEIDASNNEDINPSALLSDGQSESETEINEDQSPNEKSPSKVIEYICRLYSDASQEQTNEQVVGGEGIVAVEKGLNPQHEDTNVKEAAETLVQKNEQLLHNEVTEKPVVEAVENDAVGKGLNTQEPMVEAEDVHMKEVGQNVVETSEDLLHKEGTQEPMVEVEQVNPKKIDEIDGNTPLSYVKQPKEIEVSKDVNANEKSPLAIIPYSDPFQDRYEISLPSQKRQGSQTNTLMSKKTKSENEAGTRHGMNLEETPKNDMDKQSMIDQNRFGEIGKPVITDATPLQVIYPVETKRECRPSKWLLSPYGQKYQNTRPGIDKKLVEYVTDPNLNQLEIVYKSNTTKLPQLSRFDFLSLRPKYQISTMIISTCVHNMNKYSLHQEQLKRLSLTIDSTEAIERIVNKHDFHDERSSDECADWFDQRLDQFDYMEKDRIDVSKIEFVFMPMIHNQHYSLFVVNIKEKKCQYLDSLSQIGLTPLVEKVGRYAARGVISYINRMTGGPDQWGSNWETPNVPQQPPRSNSCGLFMVRFMEEWEGEQNKMSSFIVWESLDSSKKNAMVKSERSLLAFQIVTSMDNSISEDVIQQAKYHAEQKKAQKKQKT